MQDKGVQGWIDAQSYPEDALTYLIQKELYEYGERDLSYAIPRKRNDAYFEALLQKESYDSRIHTNMDLYDSIAVVHKEHHITPTQQMPVTPAPATDPTPITTSPTPINSIAKKQSTRPQHGKTITSINKRKDIYHTTSSAVVVTGPEDLFEEKDVDMTCFED